MCLFNIKSRSVIVTTIFFLSLYGKINYAQQSNRFFDSGAEITVDYLPENDFFYIHIVDKGISLYSLAKVFKVSLEEVLAKNNLNPNMPINEGKIVKIPLKKNRVVLAPPHHKHYKLLYQVKPKETLYSLARKCNTDVNTILKLNNRTQKDIKSGEKLCVGYYLIDNPTDTPSDKANEYETINDSSKEKYISTHLIGFCDKSSTSSLLFVLYNEAKIGSIMDIYNPMMKRQIKAKVIGKIPTSTYPEDVEIIISPQCARDLGILDSRFKVNVKYEK